MGHDIITQGGSAADVMNILGHATLASSSIYTMMTGKELENRYRTFKGK
jgi:site-specific recombinase XerD